MTNEIVSYDSAWAKQADEAVRSDASSGGRTITHRGGVFRVGDTLEFAELCVVILDDMHERAWYPGSFDPDNLVPPRCFAIAKAINDLAPHENTHNDAAFEPQADSCAACPKSKFPKKGAPGRPECRSRRRLLVLPAGQYHKRKGSRDLDLELFITDNIDESAEYIQGGDIYTIKIPPTSLALYDALKREMRDKYRRPPHGMIVRMYTEPRKNGGHSVHFEPLGALPDALYPAIQARREADADILLRPYTSTLSD